MIDSGNKYCIFTLSERFLETNEIVINEEQKLMVDSVCEESQLCATSGSTVSYRLNTRNTAFYNEVYYSCYYYKQILFKQRG